MIKQFAFIAAMACFSLSAFSQEITLEDIWKKGTFRQQSVYGVRSMVDGLHYTTMDRTETGTEINKYSYESGEKVETILSEEQLKTKSGDDDASIDGYRFSSNEKFLLISFDVEHIYRHSTVER